MGVSELAKLREMRAYGGTRQTVGLSDQIITQFVAEDPSLARIINEAHASHVAMREEHADALAMAEADLIGHLQAGYVNFYSPETVNPYVALCARGPWLVTTHGAVIHDSGGYGMLGAGHGPDDIIHAMSRNWVMANVMTASFAQLHLDTRLRRELGHSRAEGCPFDRFICMNSGSESVTVAARIADINARQMTDAGGRHEGATVKMLGLKGAFHGRTDRPAQISDSTRGKYQANLRTFRDRDNLITVPPNDVAALRAAFARAEANNVFIEAMFLEPVMGEGVPGRAVTRAFYDAARELTLAHGSLMLVDSIQAGLRGTGALSIVDYPGFQDAQAPDMETYSKALNGGQYPLSVLAMTSRAANLYVRGVYGNTMTTNPRALEVACAMLDSITPAIRQNIRDRGDEFVAKLKTLQSEFPDLIVSVEGTGLLLAAELNPDRAQVVGFDGVETWCRLNGLGVIHGGINALRFTPHFRLTSAEIDMVIDVLRAAMRRWSALAA